MTDSSVPVTQIMSREVRCARQDDAVEDLIQLMIRNRIGCMPIVNHVGRPVGMVTKLDLVNRGTAQFLRPPRSGPQTLRRDRRSRAKPTLIRDLRSWHDS